MEKVEKEDHPLSSSEWDCWEGGTQSHSTVREKFLQEPLQRSPSASLIQSAVRSVLDDASPSTIVSDDRSDPGSCVEGDIGKARDTSRAMLSSLETETLPPIPSEQDRQNFIGCLAAVLASSTDYKEPELSSGDLVSDSPGGVFEGDGDEEGDGDVSQGEPRSSSFATNTPLSEAGTGELGGDRAHNPNVEENGRHPVSERHRGRRYDICYNLLVSSPELLLLKTSVPPHLLRLLDRLLVPQKPHNCDTATQPKQSAGIQNYPSPPPCGIDLQVEKSLPEHADVPSIQVPSSRTGVADPKLGYDVDVDDNEVFQQCVSALSPGSGFRCMSLLLLQHLLTSEVGYDARIRHALKKLGVLVLLREIRADPVERELLPILEEGTPAGKLDLLRHATRKFEALERSIARRLIRLSESATDRMSQNSQGIAQSVRSKASGLTRDKLVRGMKIGSAGVVAGTLFALSGGLAAPGIAAAGVAAVAGSAAATAAVVAITSTAVVTTIFGVGGGSLAAYKMQRRTQGLTEFEFRKEGPPGRSQREDYVNTRSGIEAELFSTVCISGWLTDKFDFQRPWGLHPTRPRLTDRMELLERFYSIHRPDHVPNCAKILANWKGEETGLWSVLKEKYGRDPDHLLPLVGGQKKLGSLTLEQEEMLDNLFVELGYNSVANRTGEPSQVTPFERMKENWGFRQRPNRRVAPTKHRPAGFDSMHGPYDGAGCGEVLINVPQSKINVEDSSGAPREEFTPPKHLATVWDYKSTYGGELYTVRWESALLENLCDCVMDLAMDVVSGATRQILKQTFLHQLLAAVVFPTYLLNVANMIDGDWTLAVERADEAGKEMARILLFSRAGCRPVTLVGFSFGARVIYSCLKELARLQDEWEEECSRNSTAQEPSHSKSGDMFKGMREPASIVEDAIVMGLPNHLSLPSWTACRRIVAGRLVNCYSTKDLILSLMFQAKRFSPGVETILKPVCGTCPVHAIGVENVDVSDLILGHQDYCLNTGRILHRISHGQPLRYRNPPPVT